MTRRTYVPYSARNRHIYIGGASQHGKSTLLERMITQDMEAGCGITVLDPKAQGPLAEAILKRVPPEREHKAIYLDIADPVPIDVMSWETEKDRVTLAGELHNLFLGFSTTKEGDQWLSILRAAIHTLLAAKHCSFLDLNRIFVNKEFLETVLSRVRANNKDGIYQHILEYWKDDFPQLKSDAAQPIVTRMKQFLFSPLAKILGCPDASLKISDIIRDRKILIVNLGTLDKDAGNLVGKLIVAKLQQMIFHQHPSAATPHFLYADEFQNFQTSAFDVILSEAGGFRLCLTLANQGFYQLDENILKAMSTNVTAARIAFRISPEDVSNWKHLAEPGIDPKMLAKLPPHSAFYAVGDEPPIIKQTREPLEDPTEEQIKNAEIIRIRTVDTYACNTAPRPHTERNDPPQEDRPPDPVPPNKRAFRRPGGAG